MSKPDHCPACDAILPESQPKGLCPRCALSGLLQADLPSTKTTTGVTSLPRNFGDYTLLTEIARGGMGVVFQARQKSLDRVVAVKLLLSGPHTDAEFIKRFRVEASAAAALQHPNIVSIHEVGVHEGEHFIAMEFVDGPNLAKVVREHPLPPKRAAKYLQTIAEAIHYAHEQGILHRDLKPSNVLLDAHDQPRVTDFGLAKRVGTESQPATDLSQITLSGQVMGSPGYMPPEQASGRRGAMSHRSDVYSLGAMLYHLLTGRPPFGGGSIAETLRQVETQEPVSLRLLNPGVPLDLETICFKCLQKEPARRYATAQELSEELRRYFNDESIRARPIGRAEKVWRWCRRNPMAAALIIALCTGLAACLVLLRIVSQQERAHRASLNTMVKSISARVSDLPISPRPFEHFSAEEVQILLGKNPVPNRTSARLTVATFIDQTPMQTLITFGTLIDRIGKLMQDARGGAAQLDLRIYKDYTALQEDLANGVVHFASVDGPTCLAAQATNPAVRALVCDQRPGVLTIIFVRADSDITNLAGLKGHSLGVPDKLLFPVAFVFAPLVDAGLCARDVRCSVLAENRTDDGEQRIAIRKSQAGSYGEHSNARQAVLGSKSFTAGVAFTRQMQPEQEGVTWRRLATFHTPDFLWVAGSKVDSLSRDAFVGALLRFTNPKDLESALVDTDTDGFAYTTATEPCLETLRAAERVRIRFEECQPATNLTASPRPPTNSN